MTKRKAIERCRKLEPPHNCNFHESCSLTFLLSIETKVEQDYITENMIPLSPNWRCPFSGLIWLGGVYNRKTAEWYWEAPHLPAHLENKIKDNDHRHRLNVGFSFWGRALDMSVVVKARSKMCIKLFPTDNYSWTFGRCDLYHASICEIKRYY